MKKKFSRVIAHYLPQCLLLISLLTSNVLFPATVIAQEIENTNNVIQEETVPIDTSEDILEEGISTSVFEETEVETEVETEKEIIEEEEVVEPLFVFENGIYTVNTVVEGEEYVYPDNNDVRVKFTEVTQEGNLVIKRVELTEEQKELLNTKDNYGWDITSSMSNGTFKYNLTLPNTHGNENIEVKYTEDNNTYESIDNSNIEIKSNVVTIEGLEHFTIFVVSGVNNTGSCDGATITAPTGTTACYSTIQAAINNANSGDTINLSSDFTITQQININKSLILNGNNHKIFSNFTKTGNVNNSAIGIFANNFTLNDLTVDGSNGKKLHGINVYEATNVVLNNVTLKNNKKIGLVVNGSDVTVNDIKTSNNGWYGINVDYQKEDGRRSATLTIEGTSSHDEFSPIYIDNRRKNNVKVIPNNQYYYDDYDFFNIHSRVYRLDKTPPSIPVLVSPIDGISINDNTPLMEWEDSTDFGTGVSGYYLEIYPNCTDFNDVSTCQPVYSNTTGDLLVSSDYQASNLPENTYFWRVKAVDKAGNKSNWSNLGKFIIDTPPVFSLLGIKYTYLEDGVSKTVVQDRYITNWNTPIFVGKLTSTDIASVKVIINGTEYPAAINDNDMTWEATISSLLVDGSYNVEIIATDSAGNFTTIEKELIIDTVAPTAQYTYYKDETAITGPAYVQRVDQLSFKAEYLDETPSSGILQDSYVIFVSNAEGTARTGTAYCGWRNPNNTLIITTNPLEQFVPFTNCEPTLEDGQYYMYHQVYDNATRKDIPDITQYREVKGLYFIVDTQNPNGSINGIQDSINFFTKDTTPVLFGTYSDNYGVSNITVKINEEIITPTYSEGNWVSSEFQTLTDGNYTATLTITDFAGNTITESKNITIDTTAPSVSNINITKNGNSVTYVKKGDEITISATIIDNLSGINAVTADFSYDSTYSNNNRPDPIHTSMTLKSGEVYETTFTIPNNWNEGDLYITVAALDNARNYNGNRGSAKELTIDNTAPDKPTGLHRRNIAGDEFECGDTAKRQTMIPDWDDINITDDPTFSHFEYSSFNADGSQGKDEMILYTSEFESGWVAPVDGTYGYTVRSVDKAGNKSAWASGEETLEGSCQITYDSIGPVVTLTSPEDNYYTNRTSVRQEWTTTATDVDHYEYRSCKNNPSVDGVCTPIYSETTENQYRTVHNNNISFWWQVRGIDNVGNKGAWSEARKITIDTIAPDTPEIEYPLPESYFNSSPIRNEWTEVSDSSGIAFYRVLYVYDDGHTFSGGPYRTTTSTFRNHTPDIGEQGGVTISVQAVDNAGNKSEWSNSIHYTYDETPPTTPTNGAPNGTYITTNDFYFTWSASNDKSPLIYEFQSSSSNVVDENGSLINAWNSIRDGNSEQKNLTSPQIHSTGASDGLYYWQVRAIDAAGNYSGWSDVWSVTIDTKVPSKPVITNTPDNAFTNINAITVNWEGGDDQGTNPSGIKGYIIGYVFTSANENTVTDWTSGLVEVGNPKKHSGTYGHGEGKYVIYVKTVDNAGNESPESGPYTITYDSTPPVITLDTYNTDWTNQDITVNASTNEGTLNSDSHTFTENGSFDFIATDRAGNSTTKTVTITNIDKTNPTVDSISISNGLLTVTSTDTHSGVKSVEVKIDDGEWISYTTDMNLNTILNNTPGTYTIYVKVTDKAGNPTEDSMEYTIPQPAPAPTTAQEAVLGATTTNTTTKTTTKGITSPISTTQTEEILETTSIEEPSVLGERCENKKKVSGNVYLDKNKDNEMNENEEGIKDITLTIQYTDEEGNIKTEEEVSTDEKGYWETQLCSGKYNIVVKKDTLPKNIEVSEVLSLTVSDNEEETIFNIQALDTRNFWQKYWYLIVGGLAIIVIGYISIKNRKKEEI